jgi:transposase
LNRRRKQTPPYLSLITPEAPQRPHDLREVFNALGYLVRTGAPWRYLTADFPPWAAVYQQTQRWIKGGCFEAIVVAGDRSAPPPLCTAM